MAPLTMSALNWYVHRCLPKAVQSLLLHTQFIDVLQEDGRITGVVAANKSGLFLFRAKVVIDCSGDADVAARSGVKFELGRVEDGNMQPATLFFRVGNVDTPRLKAHIREHRDEIRPFYRAFELADAGESRRMGRRAPRRGVSV